MSSVSGTPPVPQVPSGGPEGDAWSQLPGYLLLPSHPPAQPRQDHSSPLPSRGCFEVPPLKGLGPCRGGPLCGQGGLGGRPSGLDLEHPSLLGLADGCSGSRG